MALKTQAPNWFEVPADLVDKYIRGLTPLQVCVLLVLFRRECGYPAVYNTSTADIAETLGVAATRVTAALKVLQENSYVAGGAAEGWVLVWA